MRFTLLALLLLTTFVLANEGEEASYSFAKGRALQALNQYQSALKVAIARADTKREILYLNNVASLYYSLGEKDSSALYLELAKKAARFSEPMTAIVEANRALLEERSIELSESKLKMWEDSLSHFEMAALYIVASRFDIRAKKYSRAEKYLNRVHKLLKNEKKSSLYADAFFRLSQVYSAQSLWAKSDEKGSEALQLYQEGGFTSGIKKTLTLLAFNADKQGRSDRAVLYKDQLSRLPSDLR